MDPTLTDRSFFEIPKVFPWGGSQPDDNNGNEDAIV